MQGGNREVFNINSRLTDIQNPNIKYVHKFGRNDNISTTHEDIWMGGGLYNWQQNASTIYAVSTSAQDAVGGSGIHTILVQGLDVNCNEIEEEIDLTGSTSAVTSKSFLRVNRAFGVTGGTYHGSNFDVITLSSSLNGQSLAIIDGDPFAVTGTSEYGIGQTESSIYTVPAGYTAYITHIEINVDVGASKTATVVLYQCGVENGSVRRALWIADSVSGGFVNDFKSPLKVKEKTDIWGHARASASAAIDIDYSLFLVKNI